MKDEQYGNSSKASGRSPSLNEHKGPKEQDKEHFSQMAVVDTKEMHNETLASMGQKADHVASMPISDRNAYKRQAHAVKPSGEIQSFVGDHLDTHKGDAISRSPKSPDGNYKKD